MNVIRLKEILRETTVVLSKGPQTRHYLESMGVPELLWDTMPEIHECPGDLEMVDCQFLVMGVSPAKAAKYSDAFIQILEQYPNKGEMRDGPSYKHLTPLLGDDISSLRVFALGDVLGLWSLALPEDLGVEPAARDIAAVLGWLCITGYPQSILSEGTAAVC